MPVRFTAEKTLSSRQSSAELLQTLQTAGEGEALSQRLEITCPLKSVVCHPETVTCDSDTRKQVASYVWIGYRGLASLICKQPVFVKNAVSNFLPFLHSTFYTQVLFQKPFK